MLYSIVVAVVTFGVLVTFHEYGHFWVARRAGVRVLRFSIGFGKALYRWRDRLGTEYVVCVLPLGGYVKMLDEREGPVDPADYDQAFNRKPLRWRTAIVAAGPIANFMLAIVAYWLVYVSGVSGVVPLVGGVEEDSIAYRAGLDEGMEVVTVDGQHTPTWRAVNQELLNRIGESGVIVVGVREGDSSLEYEHRLRIERWLVGAEAPDLLGSLGIAPYAPTIAPRIDQVLPDGAALASGVQSGDLILAVDGQVMADWGQWVDYVRARPGQELAVVIERGRERLTLMMTPEPYDEGEGAIIGRLGVSVVVPEYPDDLIRQFHYNPLSAFGEAVSQTWSVTLFTLDSIKKLLSGLISPKNLSGPITIAKVASASAQSGLESWLGVLALLSISLGVLNLLPIPVLDGGHLLFYLVEWVKGSEVSERVQNLGFQVGISIVLGIMLLAIYNDLSRL